MNYLLNLFVKGREQVAQAMSEYALIMAAIAVAAMVAYSTLGNHVSALANNVSGQL